MKPSLARTLRQPPLHLALFLSLAIGLATFAQPTPLPGIGEVGQGIEWRGSLAPTPLSVFDTVRFEGRGVVGTEADRLIAVLSIVADEEGLVASGRFPALGGGDAVRIELFDGEVPVAEVDLGADDAATPGAVRARSGSHPEGAVLRRPTAAVSAVGDVTIGPGAAPTLRGTVRVAIFRFARVAFDSQEVVPAPVLELALGERTPVRLGADTYEATTVRFLATRPFPPPGSSSSILQRVDVFAGSSLGGGSGPTLDFTSEHVEPGVLFSGVPVQPDEGTLGVLFDDARDTISGVALEPTASPAFLLTGDAAGVSVAWKAADLAAGFPGSSVELAAIGRNIASVQVRGVVTATRTEEGWDLSFQPPGGLGDVPRTVEVDGGPVGQVTVPAPAGVFARVSEPPSGAAVFPIGLGEGAFYGFSWDAPAAITVPGVGTFTGREVRLVFPEGIGPLAFGGVSIHDLPRLTLTGLAAPAIDDGGPCIASATRLCLAGGRFAVDVAWADPFGGSGPGVAVPLTEDTGAFWFFGEANLELMVKVLEACPVNGHVWVFAGGLTNVEVELVVTDTRTGVERVYRNPQGQAFQPIQDTAAFVCAP